MANRLSFLLVASSIFVWAIPANAQVNATDPARLDSLVEQQAVSAREAKALATQKKKTEKQITRLQRDLAKLAARARGLEKMSNGTRNELKVLEAREAAMQAEMFADRQAMAQMLAAMQRVEAQPPPPILVSGTDAVSAARSTSMLLYVSEKLHGRANLLQTQISELSSVRTSILEKQSEFATTQIQIDEQRSEINKKIVEKEQLASIIDTNRRAKIAEARRLSQEAKTLRDLIEKFESVAREVTPRLKPGESLLPVPRRKPRKGAPTILPYKAPPGTRFADMRGQLPLPVSGRLTQAYGSRLKNGGRLKGIKLRTQPGAHVVAPFSGRVEFAGPFNDEDVVILNVGDGYFIVLTGLGSTDVKAASRVAAGEPLGRMPDRSRPTIFVEFRKDRSTIDPTPWLNSGLTK